MSPSAAPRPDGVTDETFYQVDYQQGGGAQRLMRYMDGKTPPLRDRTGKEMSDREIEEFVERTNRHGGFRRHVIISPDDRHDIEREDMDRAARRYAREYTDDKPTATYAYALWDGDREDEPHVHIAVSGDRRELYLDRHDIYEERQRAHECFQARTLSMSQRRERERARDLEQEQTREQSREQSRESDMGFES